MTNFRKTLKVLLVIGLTLGLSFGPASVAIASTTIQQQPRHLVAIQTVKPFVFQKSFVAKMDKGIPDIITPVIVKIVPPSLANKLPAPVRKAPRIAKTPIMNSGPILSGNYPSVATWQKIAQCESGNRWNINTGNGYYGGLQENMAFWRGNGGLAYAARPDLATEMQQIAVADNAYRTRGFEPWQCGWAAYK
jgi:hypothetical protein